MPTRPRTIAERLSRAAETSFVGRERELAELRGAVEASELPFVVVFVNGPGGIGKSTFVRAACRTSSSDVRTLALDCRDIEPTSDGFMAALATALGLTDAPSLDRVVAGLVAGVKRAVVVLDTYETFGLMDSWLRNVFIPALPDGVLTVIAGREAPNVAWTTTPGWQGLTRIIQLHELPEQDAELGVDQPPPSAAPARGRHLATVLFTDIVGATERAVALGDRRWRELLERHHARVRAELARHDGREVDTAGDGFLATFDTPVQALRCALASVDALRPLGLSIRAGVHTGECEPIGEKLAGIAVHIGARVAARAEADEVWVSSTVKDLAAGADLVFEDRGFHSLKGIPGDWKLFAVTPSRPNHG